MVILCNQHDLISYFAGLLGTRIRYLEIGVSVGKGLLTQLNFLGSKAEVSMFNFSLLNKFNKLMSKSRLKFIHYVN